MQATNHLSIYFNVSLLNHIREQNQILPSPPPDHIINKRRNHSHLERFTSGASIKTSIATESIRKKKIILNKSNWIFFFFISHKSTQDPVTKIKREETKQRHLFLDFSGVEMA